MTDKRNDLLVQYAGLASQLLAGLGIAIYGGMWVDKKMAFKKPLAIWLLPLLILAAMLIKVIRDTSKKNDDKRKD